MRYVWQQIQQMYPDQWVLLKDMEFTNGNLVSAVILCTSKERQDIYRFEDERPTDVDCLTYTKYTGNPVDFVEYNDDDLYIEELEDAI